MKAEEIKLYGTRVLLKPVGKPFTYEVDVPVAKQPTKLGDVTDLDTVPETEVTMEKREVKSEYQWGKVIAIGDDKNIPCVVGDVVNNKLKSATSFEPMRKQDIQLINYYNIVAVKQVKI